MYMQPVYTERMPEGWLTVSEAASRSGLKPQQIRDAIRRGNLKADQHGSIWMIRTKDIDAFEIKPAGRPKRKRGRPRKVG
jgi:excisionase family DNA binding protein